MGYELDKDSENTDVSLGLTELLDNLDMIIYVVEASSMKLLFANRRAIEDKGSTDYHGLPCYAFIRGRDTKCPTCISGKIPENEKVYIEDWYDEDRDLFYHTKSLKLNFQGIPAYAFFIDTITESRIEKSINSQLAYNEFDYIGTINIQKRILSIRVAGNDKNLPAPESGNDYETTLHSFLNEHTSKDDAVSAYEAMSLKHLITELDTSGFYVWTVSMYDRPDGAIYKKQFKYTYLDSFHKTILLTRSDITEAFNKERQNADRLEIALTAAKQASSAKTDFLSRMSHEIRTPMNAIIGMDTLAAQAIGDDERVADCLSKIGISARYLLSLINDILDMSRIESGKMLLNSNKFAFSDFITGVNTLIYNQAALKGLDYECIVSSDVADGYIGDAMKLQQILINVLGNAVKFTDKGKVSLDVRTVSKSGSISLIRFSVNDTGCGISEDHLDRIFEPFEQEDTTSTSSFGGSGLGLAITKNLTDIMGGHIRVRSIVNVGSEFTIEIPLSVDTECKIAPHPEYHFEKLHVMVVDDDLFICEQTSSILKDMGITGEWVTTGREAVERVRLKSEKASFYDYILIDWKMPDMDGIETTRQIRRIVGPDVTIIIISAYDWESIEAEAKAAGANLLITKPVLKSTLISAFQKTLGSCEESNDSVFDYDFSGRRLLVAEDNQINAEIAKSLLENRNFEVDIAENGLRAMEMFVQSRIGYYDAILMDIRMPMMDGLQATVNIRHWSREDAKTIPIIAMTANAFDEDVEKSKAAGMNAHLSKPIEPELLYRTLYRILIEKEE